MGTTAQKLQALINSKEAIRLAIIGKNEPVGVDEPLSSFPAHVAAIQSGGVETPIQFASFEVKTICATNWGSGGELTPTQAAAVTSAQFGITFKNNQSISSFSELYYFTGLTSIPDNAFNGCVKLSGTLIIPANVVTIGAYAFSGCKFSGSLTIPASVTTINDHAFYQCLGFSGNLVIPDTVTSLGSGGYQFSLWNLVAQGSLTIGNGITTIPQSCFASSNFSGTLTIPASVTTIDAYAFSLCRLFTGALVIPNTVTSLAVGGYQFNACNGLNGTLTISTGITSIPTYCFNGCSKLSGFLDIPSNITSIEASAFSGYCTKFTGNLVIPDSVTTIGVSAFQAFGTAGTTGNLILGTGLTVIPITCFSGCNCNGTLTIPANVAYIDASAFALCTSFTGNLSVNCGLGSIGGQFKGCTGMTGLLTIGVDITTIPLSCFESTPFTGQIIIPDNVVSIGNNAFKNITALTYLTDQRATPPTLGTTVFSGTFPIYVPAASVATYKAAANWSAYAARIAGY